MIPWWKSQVVLHSPYKMGLPCSLGRWGEVMASCKHTAGCCRIESKYNYCLAGVFTTHWLQGIHDCKALWTNKVCYVRSIRLSSHSYANMFQELCNVDMATCKSLLIAHTPLPISYSLLTHPPPPLSHDSHRYPACPAYLHKQIFKSLM